MSRIQPLSREEKALSYAKYYYKELEPIPKEKLDIIKAGPMDNSKALSVYDRNKMFDTGYFDVETGYCVMEDGTGFLANKTEMPGVTAEMFAWWFAWHALEDVRYKIWVPKDHRYARNMQPEKILNFDTPILERNWGTTHEIVEDIGFGDDRLTIKFKRPEEMGLDASKIGTKYCSAIQTGNGTGDNLNTVLMHMVRDIPGGIELRSRFWIGYHIVDQKPKKLLPDGVEVPLIAPQKLFEHNCLEFTNLAALLPKVYAEEKDNW